MDPILYQPSALYYQERVPNSLNLKTHESRHGVLSLEKENDRDVLTSIQVAESFNLFLCFRGIDLICS